MKLITIDIKRIVAKILGRKNPLLGELIINWAKIVGLKFSSKSFPFKITNKFENGKKINILYVTTNSSIVTEISYEQGIILNRIAIYLGYKAIHKLRFIIE